VDLLNNFAPVLGEAYDYLGPVGALLIIVSAFSLTLIVIKLAALFRYRLSLPKDIDGMLKSFQDRHDGLNLPQRNRAAYPTEVLLRQCMKLSDAGQGIASIQTEIRRMAVEKLAGLEKYNRLLELVGLISPLLGLLGTILGMVAAFQTLQNTGGQADPGILAGGIWEALLTTALGLIIAIPAIVVHNICDNRYDKIQEQASLVLDQFFTSLDQSLKVD